MELSCGSSARSWEKRSPSTDHKLSRLRTKSVLKVWLWVDTFIQLTTTFMNKEHFCESFSWSVSKGFKRNIKSQPFIPHKDAFRFSAWPWWNWQIRASCAKSSVYHGASVSLHVLLDWRPLVLSVVRYSVPQLSSTILASRGCVSRSCSVQVLCSEDYSLRFLNDTLILVCDFITYKRSETFSNWL